MSRILVTGASGFIGSHVVTRLAQLGHRVVATGRSQSRLEPLTADAVRVVVADLSVDPLEGLVEDCDAVVHCAALSSPWGRAEDFWNCNVLATERLLEAGQRARVRRFIHLGSPSIYFRFADQYGIGEPFQAPQTWITDYARSKWESELRVRAAAAKGLQAIVLRPRAVFGERDNAILPRILAVAERGWFPLVHRGEAVIDITYIGNLVQLIVDCLSADVAADGSAYNVTNAQPLAVRQLVSRLFSSLDKDVRLVPVPRWLALPAAGIAERIARLRAGRPEPRITRYGLGVIGYSQTLDISRARRELAYSPTISVDEGLGRFATWWRQHAAA
jgi:nucleoside-diphosphate-sugar epimerase